MSAKLALGWFGRRERSARRGRNGVEGREAEFSPLQLHHQRLLGVERVHRVSCFPLRVPELVVLVQAMPTVAEAVNGDLVAQGKGHEDLE